MKQIAIVISFTLLMLVGCAPCKHLSTNSKDSVRIEYRTRVEYVPDTVVVEIPVQSEKITTRDTTSHLENDYAQTDARINGDGTLFHSLATKPQKKPVPVERPIEYRDSIVYRDRAVEKIVTVERELSWWQQTQIRGFWVAVIIFIFIYRKKIFSLIRRFI
jgi:hypothetical protein